MTAHGLAFRQDFAAPTPATDRRNPSAADSIRALLIDQQRDDGYWTDEWADRPATAGPVGVTARAVIALIDGGMSHAAPEVSRAVDWLWGRTVAPAAKDPDPPEAESLAALTAFLRAGRASPAIVADAVEALREIQNDDGGWSLATDDRPDGEESRPNATGDVLTVFGLCGVTAADTTVRAALAYLERDQEPDSGWGDWAATAAVLAGLRAVGVDSRWLPVRRAAEWIKRTQLAGGGWGQPDVTATADGLRVLRAANDESGPEVEAGRAWLIANPPDASALLPLIAAVSALNRSIQE